MPATDARDGEEDPICDADEGALQSKMETTPKVPLLLAKGSISFEEWARMGHSSTIRGKAASHTISKQRHISTPLRSGESRRQAPRRELQDAKKQADDLQRLERALLNEQLRHEQLCQFESLGGSDSQAVVRSEQGQLHSQQVGLLAEEIAQMPLQREYLISSPKVEDHDVEKWPQQRDHQDERGVAYRQMKQLVNTAAVEWKDKSHTQLKECTHSEPMRRRRDTATIQTSDAINAEQQLFESYGRTPSSVKEEQTEVETVHESQNGAETSTHEKAHEVVKQDVGHQSKQTKDVMSTQVCVQDHVHRPNRVSAKNVPQQQRSDKDWTLACRSNQAAPNENSSKHGTSERPPPQKVVQAEWTEVKIAHTIKKDTERSTPVKQYVEHNPKQTKDFTSTQVRIQAHVHQPLRAGAENAPQQARSDKDQKLTCRRDQAPPSDNSSKHRKSEPLPSQKVVQAHRDAGTAALKRAARAARHRLEVKSSAAAGVFSECPAEVPPRKKARLGEQLRHLMHHP